jgi:hypothetical protein
MVHDENILGVIANFRDVTDKCNRLLSKRADKFAKIAT